MHKWLLATLGLLALSLLLWKPFTAKGGIEALQQDTLPGDEESAESPTRLSGPNQTNRPSRGSPPKEALSQTEQTEPDVTLQEFLDAFIQPKPGWQETLSQTVRVRVVDAEQNPIPRFEVIPWFGSASGKQVWERNERTDENGVVEFSLSSRWSSPSQKVRVPAEDTWHFQPYDNWLRDATASIRLRPGPHQEVTLELARRCTVTFALAGPDGSPFTDSARLAIHFHDSQSCYRTFAHGEARVAILPFDVPYSYKVTTDAPYLPVRGDADPIRPGEPSRRHEVQLGDLSPTISFHLHDPGGQALANTRGTVRAGTAQRLREHGLQRFRARCFV